MTIGGVVQGEVRLGFRLQNEAGRCTLETSRKEENSPVPSINHQSDEDYLGRMELEDLMESALSYAFQN